MRSMRFSDIAFSSLKRRRGRTIFLILSLSVGVAMIVVVISVTAAMRTSVESKLREFGANMVIMPKTLGMPITYGGVNISVIMVTHNQDVARGARRLIYLRDAKIVASDGQI